jgi:DNA-binding GntR family transcriptional regulator
MAKAGTNGGAVTPREGAAPVTSAEGPSEGTAYLVWRSVLRGLYEGRYAPGQRLTEAELTQEFDVSRSSVREALSRLAAEGVVVVQRHKGAVIRSAGKAEFLEILTVLDALIPLGARLAAENIEDAANRQLAEEELQRLASAKGELASFDLARERNRFYRTLITLANNSELRRVMSQIHVHPLRIQLGEKRSASAVFADYVAILTAILAGDPIRAELGAKAHVRTNIDQIRALSDD